MSRFVRAGTVAAAAVALLLSTAACGSSGGGDTSAPVKIGSVSGITGSAVFPEASKAAQAVFDRVNAEGGINGRKIQYIAEDDKGDPAVAAQAARKLVDDDGVVALAGSASALECAVNQSYYKSRDVLSVQGLGVDPACYNSPNISPVNSGPFVGITAALDYASSQLKRTKVCAFMNTFPGWGPAQDAAVKAWESQSGMKMTYYKRDLTPQDDLTPYVLAARDAGCQAVLAFGLDFQAITTMKAVAQQHVTGIDWLFSSAAYTQNVASALNSTGEAMYATSEFAPFTGDTTSKALADLTSLLKKDGIPLTSFAEGGYLAATVMVDTLKGIHGTIDRKSVTAALRKTTAYKSDLIGSPYRFGSSATHSSNRTVKIVQLHNGAWQTITPSWIQVPAT